MKSVPGPDEESLTQVHKTLGARIPDFLWSFVGSLNFMRLSLKKGAHAVLSRAAYRKFGASRSFFARCGIPQAFPSSLLRSPPWAHRESCNRAQRNVCNAVAKRLPGVLT